MSQRKVTDERATTLPASGTVFAFDGALGASGRALAVEVPVQVAYGTVPYAVMMMSPTDLEDFAAGFSLTEGVVAQADDLRGVAVTEEPDGIRLDIQLAPARLHAVLARRRAMAGRTSCGVCGIEELHALPRAAVRPRAAGPLRLAAIQAAVAALPAGQALNRATGAMHAAAWADADGRLLLVREDVGRHTALDKLAGAVLRQGLDPAAGFVVVTSRCSFEMIEKTAALGAPALVAVSAPTSLGVARAEAHGLVLAGVARADSVTVYAGADRIVAG